MSGYWCNIKTVEKSAIIYWSSTTDGKALKWIRSIRLTFLISSPDQAGTACVILPSISSLSVIRFTYLTWLRSLEGSGKMCQVNQDMHHAKAWAQICLPICISTTVYYTHMALSIYTLAVTTLLGLSPRISQIIWERRWRQRFWKQVGFRHYNRNGVKQFGINVILRITTQMQPELWQRLVTCVHFCEVVDFTQNKIR